MTPEGAVVVLGGISTILDSEDVPRVLDSGPWRPHRGSERQYFVHTTPRPQHKNILLHRFLIGAADGMEVDHINGNPLDNRKGNLRLCTHAENLRNTKLRVSNKCGFKGVSFDARRGMWRSRVTVDGAEVWLGYFDSAKDAHAAYCAAAKKLHGEFMRAE